MATNVEVYRAYHNVFGAANGKLVLEDLQKAHFINGPMTSHPIDPYALAYNEGQRNVVLRIMSILESKEQDYDNRDNRSDGLNIGPGRFSTESVNTAVNELFGAGTGPGDPRSPDI